VTDRPRGKLPGASDAVRHLWSVLYRATRRQAIHVDRHERRLAALEGRVRSLELRVDALVGRVDGEDPP
jgi:hypothetical protein